MANEISKINSWNIERFSNDKLVNTISIVPTLDLDLNKENIYPLVNLDMTGTNIEDQVILVDYTITIIQQRDKRPVQTDNKLLGNINYIDNINETHSIAQKYINYLLRQNNELLIEIDSISKTQILKDWHGGGMDGVQFTITLSIPNIETGC